jgi:hypothetical protein
VNLGAARFRTTRHPVEIFITVGDRPMSLARPPAHPRHPRTERPRSRAARPPLLTHPYARAMWWPMAARIGRAHPDEAAESTPSTRAARDLFQRNHKVYDAIDRARGSTPLSTRSRRLARGPPPAPPAPSRNSAPAAQRGSSPAEKSAVNAPGTGVAVTWPSTAE